MQYEVENKFPVESLSALTADLKAMGVEFSAPIEQIDTYFAHPVRDFGQTDEAFRLRRVGNQNRVTYKGPKLATSTKTRRELELPLADGPSLFLQYAELLETLGFQTVLEVRKQRQIGHAHWDNAELEVSLDQVQGLGCFVELEIVTDQAGLEQAQSYIMHLAGELGLERPEPRSYLEMLLENHASDDSAKQQNP